MFVWVCRSKHGDVGPDFQQANNAGGTFMQTDAMEVVCRLTIDYAELPESSVARHNFLEGFRFV